MPPQAEEGALPTDTSVASDDSILNLTAARHSALWRQRWRRLETVFGPELDKTSAPFLADYEGPLTRMTRDSRAGVTCATEDGVPVATVGHTRVRVTTRGAIAALDALIRAAEPPRPFCFVLLQFNKPELTHECVLALEKLAPTEHALRIVVVDNGSTSENLERSRALLARHPFVVLLRSPENVGFARGNNIGYRYAREQLGADFIALINNDVIIEDERFVQRCLETYREWSYSVLGPDVVTAGGLHQNPWSDVIYDQSGWRALAESYRRDRQHFVAHGEARFPIPESASREKTIILNPVLQGAAQVVSPLFVRYHEEFFDDRTFLYGEEFIVSGRALLSGDLLLYASAIRVLHNESSSTAQMPSHEKMLIGYDNALLAAEITELLLAYELAEPGRPLSASHVEEALDPSRTNILVDLFFCQPGFHGGGEYGKSVFRNLVRRVEDRPDVQVWAALDPRLFIDSWVWELCRAHRVRLVDVRSFDAIAALVNRDIFDAFFCPAIVVYTGYEYMKRAGGAISFACQRTRVVGGLLDIRDLELYLDRGRVLRHRRGLRLMPQSAMSEAELAEESAAYAARAEDLRRMYVGICECRSVSALVTLSEYAHASMIRHVGACAQGVIVAYPPLKPQPHAVPFTDRDLAGRDRQFALVVNAAREEKNAAAVVRAFESLFADDRIRDGFRVALVGLSAWSDIGIERVAQPDRFVLLPHLAPEHLEDLYGRAAFLVYASLGEGFGYPPLEAMTHGTPSLASDVTSLPEVLGDAAMYCDPYDLASIREGILRILSDGVDAALMERRSAAVAARQAADADRLIDLLLSSGVEARSRRARSPSSVSVVSMTTVS